MYLIGQKIRHPGTAGGLAEVSGVFSGRDLPAGRDGVRTRVGIRGGAAATRVVRFAAAEAGEAGGPAAGDAAERAASAVSEQSGLSGGEVGRGAAGEGQGEGGAGGARRRDQSGEPDGERADFDAGGAGVVRERRAGVLLLDRSEERRVGKEGRPRW